MGWPQVTRSPRRAVALIQESSRDDVLSYVLPEAPGTTGDLFSSLVAMSLTDRVRAEAEWRRASALTRTKSCATSRCSTLELRTVRSPFMFKLVSGAEPAARATRPFGPSGSS